MGSGLQEREINLFDMLWAVCQKWRSILVCAVVFTILAGGFSYYRSLSAAKQVVVQEEQTVEDVAAELDFEEKKSADLYFEYMNMYEKQMLYNENAPIMKLNANGFYKGELSYYVDNHFEIEYPFISKTNNVIAMVNAYKAELNTEEFAGKVKEVLDVEENNSYGMELIDSGNLYGNSNSIENNEERGILTISVYAANEEVCNALKELVKEEITNKKTNVEAQFGAHDVSLLQDICQFTSDADILAYQKENVDKLQSCATNMSNLVAKFSDQQQLYVDLRAEELHVEMGVKEETETETEAAVVTPGVSKKMLALGFIGGAFLAFAVWALVYIFSNRLRLEDDFELIFGSKLLGNVPVSAKGKKKWFAFLDCFFERLRHFNQRYFEEDEALDMVAANIRIAVQKSDNRNVLITGAVCGEDEKKVTEALAKRLKKDGVKIVSVSPVLYNAESLEKLVEVGQVVLLEKAEKSLYQEVQREIEICGQQEVNLIGCVVVY